MARLPAQLRSQSLLLQPSCFMLGRLLTASAASEERKGKALRAQCLQHVRLPLGLSSRHVGGRGQKGQPCCRLGVCREAGQRSGASALLFRNEVRAHGCSGRRGQAGGTQLGWGCVCKGPLAEDNKWAGRTGGHSQGIIRAADRVGKTSPQKSNRRSAVRVLLGVSVTLN